MEESIELGRRGRKGKLIMDGGRRSNWGEGDLQSMAVGPTAAGK